MPRQKEDSVIEQIQSFFRRYQKIILVALLFSVIVAGVAVWMISRQTSVGSEPPSDAAANTSAPTSSQAESEPSSASVSSSDSDATETSLPKYLNPMTGIEMTEEEYRDMNGRRPLLVSYDNFNHAWPQSGIANADFYMEFLAEGLITRLLALYYSNPPEHIGPIRSARPYIVVKALEFDAFLAHVGGSVQALADIRNKNVADLDGLSSGAFRMIPPKKQPHNTYAYYKELMDEAEKRGYRMTSAPSFYGFGELKQMQRDQRANTVRFDYRNYEVYGDDGYTVEYRYSSEENVYTRIVNGNPCIDEIDESVISVSNIIVQFAEHQILDREGRLAIDLFSGGEGFLFRDGFVIKITWSKESDRSLTRFYDEDGLEIRLTPGKTVLHVVYPSIFTYSEVE